MQETMIDRNTRSLTSIITILLILFLGRASGQGQLYYPDPTFNPSDIGYGHADGPQQLVYDHTVDPQGRIYIVGNFWEVNGKARKYVARLHPDGSLDEDFDVGIGPNSTCFTVHVQSNGRILVGGSFHLFSGVPGWGLIRLLEDGSVDTSWSAVMMTGTTVSCIVEQPDGKILIGGAFTNVNGTYRKCIARLEADGTLDPDLTTPGSFYSTGNDLPNVSGIRILPDGKILMNGRFDAYGGVTSRCLARLHPTGAIDNTFSTGQGFTSGQTIGTTSVGDIALMPDGSMIVVGRFQFFNGIPRSGVAKLSADGILDMDHDIGSGSSFANYANGPSAVIALSDGKCIIAGDIETFDGVSVGNILRLLPDGSVDPNFQCGDGANSTIWDMRLLGDHILLAGWFDRYDHKGFNKIAKIDTDGILIESFATPGTGFNRIRMGDIPVGAMLRKNDGSITAAGSFTSYNGNFRNGLVQMDADGNIDPLHSVGTGFDQPVYALAELPDGRIVAGGWFSEYNGSAANKIILLHPDGSIDGSFDAGDGPIPIVGVAPRGMTTLRLGRADVWLAAAPTMGATMRTARNYYSFGAVARLAEGADEGAAMDQLTTLHRRARAEQIEQGDYPEDARVLLTPLLEARGPHPNAEAHVARWLAGVSLVVLLIACVNVANLMLARMVRQSREVAVRLALGISRRRLVAQLLLEGVLLGAAGGAAALAVASYAGTAISSTLLPGVAWSELGWSPGLVPLALALSALTGLLAALVPALHASRRDPGLTLRQAGAGGVTRSTARVRTGLAAAQAALCVLLLIGAGLFVRSLDAVRSVDLGLRLDGLLYVETRTRPGATTPEERSAISHSVLDRLRSHPRIEAAAGAFTAPFMGSMTNTVRLPGGDSVPQVGGGQIWMHIVSSDYFRVLDIPIVRGRAFEPNDATVDPRVVIVNETMARALWPTQDPIGQCIYPGAETECSHVVGVARDSRQREFREQSAMEFHVPLQPESAAGIIMVRPRRGADDGPALVRDAVLSVDPRIRHVRVIDATDRLAPQERSWRLGATLFSAFGALALAVAAVGLYAVLAFDMSQRTREIGVRTALGAGRASIVRLVLVRALAVSGAGIAIGALAAALLAPRMQDLLYGVGPWDVTTYVAVACTLLATAAAAALLPAHRAASVDPNTALRAE